MPTSLELYAENENEIESKACVFETEYNVRNQKMLRIHFYGNEKINCPGFKKISVKDMMENRQKVFIVLNDSTLKEFKSRIFDWTNIPTCQQKLWTTQNLEIARELKDDDEL